MAEILEKYTPKEVPTSTKFNKMVDAVNEHTEKLSELESNDERQNREINGLRDQVENYKPIVIEGNVTNAADEEDLTSEKGLLKIKNRSSLDGMGYVILRKDKSLAEQITEENTIYEVRYEFPIGNTPLEMPNGCTLSFNGGRIKSGNLVGSNTKVEGKLLNCFSLDVSFSGTFNIAHITPYLFGAQPNDVQYNATPSLEKCFELQKVSSGDVFIPQGDWNLLTPINFTNNRIIMRGTGLASRLLSMTNHFDFGGRGVGGVIENLSLAKCSGSEWYHGTCFNSVEFKSVQISNVNSNNCGIFIKGIVKNSVIDGCQIVGLGYSFISGYSESEYNTDDATGGLRSICFDDRIINNYINCVSLSTMTTEKAVFSGGVSTTMFANNYVDYWKYILRGNGANIKAYTFMNTFSNNVFDLCYTFIGKGYVSTNDLVFCNNLIFHAGWSQASGSVWGQYSTDDEVKTDQWIFIRLFSLDSIHIKGNTCRNFSENSYLLSTAHSGYPARFSEIDVLPRFHCIRYAYKSENPNEYRDVVFNGQKCVADKNGLIYWDIHELKSRLPFTKQFGTKTTFSFGANYQDVELDSCRLGYYSTLALSDIDYAHLFTDGNVRDTRGHLLTTIEVDGKSYKITRDTSNNISGVFAKDVPSIIGSMPLYKQIPLLGENGSVIKTGASSWDWSDFDSLTTRSSAVKTSVPTTKGYTGQMVWVNGVPYKYNGDAWTTEDVGLYCPKYARGTTDKRPKLPTDSVGYEYYDTTIGKKIQWNGTAWVNLDGTPLETPAA